MKDSINLPGGVNFAPQKPLVDLRDSSDPAAAEKTVQQHWLVKELKAKYEELIGRQKPAWRSLVAAGQINGLFIMGEQILRINTYNGMPRIDTPNRHDPTHVRCINKLQSYCTQMQAKWKSSKPDIVVEPYSNDDRAIAQSEKANAVVDYLQKKFFTTWFDLTEGLDNQIWGWYGRMVQPDFTQKSLFAFREILGEKIVPVGKAYAKCDKCGYMGDQKKTKKIAGRADFDACPECESLEFDFQGPLEVKIPAPVGREKVFLPEIVCRSLDFAATRWDLRHKFEESSWAIVERAVDESVVREVLGSIRFPEGESGNDFGLEALDLLATRGAAFGGRTTNAKEKEKKTVITEMYLSASDLFDIRVGTDEKTVEGTTLPAKKRLSEVFPEGCTVVGINGMALILGIYRGTHQDSSASGVFHLRPRSGAGRGIDDAREVQKQFNRRYSQVDAFMGTRGTPPILSVENAIEPRYKEMLSNPKAVIPVKLQNFPEVRSVGDLISPLQGESVPGDLLSVTFDRLEDMLQTSYHVLNFSGGNPRADNKTATGAEILDADSQEIVSPMLAVKAECNLDTVRKGFYKWCRLTPVARFIPFKERDSSGGYGITVAGRDVDGEYNWGWVPGSEAPKTRYTENQKRIGFFGLFGGVQNYFLLKQQFPRDVAELQRDFDVNLKTDSYDGVTESCRLRLSNALLMLRAQFASAERLSGLGIESAPNYAGIIRDVQPKLLAAEGRLPEKWKWFQNLLDSDEGLKMAPEERDLVAAFVVALKNLSKAAEIEVQQDAAEIQVAASEPLREQQAADQQQAAAMEQQRQASEGQAQQQQASEQNEQAAQGQTLQLLQTLAEHQNNEADRQHQAMESDKENAMREKEMQNELELERTRQNASKREASNA